MKINLFNYFAKKIGLTDMLIILPEFKHKIFFFVLLSLVVSSIDLIGIGFIGFFIVVVLKNNIKDFEFLNNFFPDLEISQLIYLLVFFFNVYLPFKGYFELHNKQKNNLLLL